MALEMGQVPAVHVQEESAVPLLKSLGLLLIATTIAIFIGPYTMKKPIVHDNASDL